MQRFSADATINIFLNFAAQNIKKLPSKVAHSVLERIWIKDTYLSQWIPQGERSHNHDELSPNLLNDFWTP